MRDWREKKKATDLSGYRELERRSNLARYGITLEQYDLLLKEQGGGCAICGAKTVGQKGRARFHVDHDHETGAVRGLLCLGCNAGIGNLGEDADRIARAAVYLKSKKLG